MKTIELHRTITDSNDRDAQALRDKLSAKGICLVNIMSSAGSGKTTLLLKLIKDLKEKAQLYVVEADIASDVDAVAVESAGANSIQAHTDGMCHMDAGMTADAMQGLLGEDLAEGEAALQLRIAFLENVGNLICPAEYDTGAHWNLMILSVPEGDDKPLKYPLMFEVADVLIVNKIDVLPYFDFDLQKLTKFAHMRNPGLTIFPISAKTGEGVAAWADWLRAQVADWKKD